MYQDIESMYLPRVKSQRIKQNKTKPKQQQKPPQTCTLTKIHSKVSIKPSYWGLWSLPCHMFLSRHTVADTDLFPYNVPQIQSESHWLFSRQPVPLLYPQPYLSWHFVSVACGVHSTEVDFIRPHFPQSHEPSCDKFFYYLLKKNLS